VTATDSAPKMITPISSETAGRLTTEAAIRDVAGRRTAAWAAARDRTQVPHARQPFSNPPNVTRLSSQRSGLSTNCTISHNGLKIGQKGQHRASGIFGAIQKVFAGKNAHRPVIASSAGNSVSPASSITPMPMASGMPSWE
jgi:hypothetical protein